MVGHAATENAATSASRRRLQVGAIVAASVLLRCGVAQFPYSGHGNKGGTVRADGTKMFGDYEAQRHWMEITLHTPVREWYTQTKDNDLEYWGLDYPPLTAYHSYLCGWVFDRIEPESVALRRSRGYETPSSKLLMRSAALASDLATLHLGAYAAARAAYPGSGDGRMPAALALVLLQPGFVLVDHGHFQFNCVCLGLAALAAACVSRGAVSAARVGVWQLVGSVVFVLSLCYKQIALYYAPAFFFHLLGRSFAAPPGGKGGGGVGGGLVCVAKLGAVVVAAFACCWWPWTSSPGEALQVLHRVFPVARGLYEDKVANFWCAVSPLLKVKRWVPDAWMVPMTLSVTVCALLPSGMCALRRPTMHNLLWTMLNSSLAFFLFAFQVHEKSILFALLPSALLAPSLPALSLQHMALTHAALSSMLPLLRRDGLTHPFCCLLALSWLTWRHTHGAVPPRGAKGAPGAAVWGLAALPVATVALHLAEAWVDPPPRYPDLHVLLLMAANAGVFMVVFAHSTLLQWRESFPQLGPLTLDKVD